MTYRKFKADYLFNGREMAGEPSVLITSGDGIVQSVVPVAEAGEGVEVYPGLLSPGFINCHCHLELSHLKGVIPEGTGLVDFLSAVIRRKPDTRARQGRAYGPAERVREAIIAGEREMLENGIVAVGDICNTGDTLDDKSARRLYYHNFIETMGFIEGAAAARFAHSREVFEEFEAVFPGSNSIVTHSPYSVSSALFRLIADFPANRLLTIHNQESEEENVFFRSGTGDFLRLYQLLGLDVSFFRGTGKRSLESCLSYFRPDQTMILVHNVATREADLQAAAGADLFFCLCPNANRYIGGLLPDVEMLIRQGCRIVIGTDSLASNHQLSILEELKTVQLAFPGVSTPTLLQWATVNGATALQLDGVMGSFVPGTRAGVVLVEGLEEGLPKEARLTAGTTVRRLL